MAFRKLPLAVSDVTLRALKRRVGFLLRKLNIERAIACCFDVAARSFASAGFHLHRCFSIERV